MENKKINTIQNGDILKKNPIFIKKIKLFKLKTSQNKIKEKKIIDEKILNDSFDSSDFFKIPSNLFIIFYFNKSDTMTPLLLYANQNTFNIDIYSLTSNKYICSLKAHKKEISNLIISNNSKNLISTSMDKTIIIWHIIKNNFEVKYKIKALNEKAYSCLLLPNNELIVSYMEKNIDIYLYSLPNLKPKRVIKTLKSSEMTIEILYWQNKNYFIIIKEHIIQIINIYNNNENYNTFFISNETEKEKQKDAFENDHLEQDLDLSVYSVEENYCKGVLINFKNNKEYLICGTTLGYVKIYDLIDKNLVYSIINYGEPRVTCVGSDCTGSCKFQLINWNNEYIICRKYSNNNEEGFVFVFDVSQYKVVSDYHIYVKNIQKLENKNYCHSLVVCKKELNEIQLWTS